MAPLFYNHSLVDYHYQVGVADRRQPVGNDERSAAREGVFEHPLHGKLR